MRRPSSGQKQQKKARIWSIGLQSSLWPGKSCRFPGRSARPDRVLPRRRRAMKSESKLNTAGGNSRRNFLEKIGALAAASVCGKCGAQQPPAQGAAAQGRGGRGGPACRCQAPSRRSRCRQFVSASRNFPHDYRIERRRGCRIVPHDRCGHPALGTRPKGWRSRSSIARSWASTAWKTGERRIRPYNKENGGKMLFATRDTASREGKRKPGRGAAEIAQGGCIAIHHGGAGDTGTDAWWRRGKLDRVQE